MSSTLSADSPSGLSRTQGRGSPSTSSDESSWSPPDTPTPIRYLPSSHSHAHFHGGVQGSSSRRGRLQSGRRIADTEFAFVVPTVKRAPNHGRAQIHGHGIARPTYLNYRGTEGLDSEETDTNTDGDFTETELGTALSDVESQIAHGPPEGFVPDLEGEEVDMALLDASSPPSSPASKSFTSDWSDRKGKKRVRMWDDDEGDMDVELSAGGSDVDGDDEMEAEGLLGLRARDKGKRPLKSAKRWSAYPIEKSASTVSVVGNICDRMGGLHASSTIIAMNNDVPLHPSVSTDLMGDAKHLHPDMKAYHNASQRAGIPCRRSRPKTCNPRKRGQQKRCFQQLTASDDPFVNLPAFQDWDGVVAKSEHKIKLTSEPSPPSEGSGMDISDAEREALVDSEMDSVSSHLNRSDVEMRSVALSGRKYSAAISPQRTKVRTMYEHDLPLAKAQLAGIDKTVSKTSRGIYRRSRYRSYPERTPGHPSTSQLHRHSPSSLLPARRYMARSHRPPIGRRARTKPGKVEFGTVLTGQAFLHFLRAKFTTQRNRRDRIQSYNKQTQAGSWRNLVGTWWGCAQVAQMVDKWWLGSIAGPDEVEVENLLLPEVMQEDETMLSPHSGSWQPEALSLVQGTKRNADEVVEQDRTLGEEYQARWARRNQLRSTELEPYRRTVRASRQARRDELRRVEVARQRFAEMAERRQVEEAQRREILRRVREEEERRRVEQRQREEREREEAAQLAREAEEARLRSEREQMAVPASPTPTESSTVSEPPEYEFPFYPVVLPRPRHTGGLASAFEPVPIPRRTRLTNQLQLSDLLPAYVPDRWTNRSPPPPPPYNARTDCHTLIAPVFIEDEDDDEEPESDDDEAGEEVAMASPLALPESRSPRRSRRRSLSPESSVEMIGAFPPRPRRLFAPTPVRPTPSQNIDPIRAFEAAVDLEEGGEDVEGEMEDIERAFAVDHDENEHEHETEMDDDEEDVVPGGRVAGVFQRVFGMVWGSSVRR